MFGIFIIALIGTCVQLIKECCTPTIPKENWANSELIYKELADEKFMENLRNGKYKL